MHTVNAFRRSPVRFKLRSLGSNLPRRSTCGVSLVETILALALLAVAISVLGQLMFGAIEQSIMARRRAEAALLAQERMEEILAHRSGLSAWEARAKKSFEFEKESESYLFKRKGLDSFRWHWQISEFQDSPWLKEIIVRVYWRRPRPTAIWPKVELHTILAVKPG